MVSSARRIFERGGGAGNLKIKKTKSKISPLRISPVFGPKLGEDQQSSSLKFSSVFGPKLGEDQKIKNKRSSPRFCPFVYSNFLPKLQRVGPCRNFAYYSMLLILSWRPKGGGGGHGTMLPPTKYAPVCGKIK